MLQCLEAAIYLKNMMWGIITGSSPQWNNTGVKPDFSFILMADSNRWSCLASSGDDVFADVHFEMAAHLVLPLPLRCHWQSHAALPFGARGLLLGAVPVEEAHRQAVDIHVLALLHNVCHPDPKVPGSWSAPLCVVPQFIVFQQVPWCGEGPSLCYAVLVRLMVVFGFLTGQVTFSVRFDATKTDWKQRTHQYWSIVEVFGTEVCGIRVKKESILNMIYRFTVRIMTENCWGE